MNNSLIITDLSAETKEKKQILRGISLTIKKGELHVIMGPNGSGKSTLANTLMGHPDYVITKGSIVSNTIDITLLPPDQRAKNGLFLGFQYPIEVNGVGFANFLRLAINERKARSEKNISPIAFRSLLSEKAKLLSFKQELTKRLLNEGFSGGEKKKAEILQLLLLKPTYAILDEPDSGLDIDAVRYIATGINSLKSTTGIILITHYQRILRFIKPDFVHVMAGGKLVKSGKALLAAQLEKNGYEKYVTN